MFRGKHLSRQCIQNDLSQNADHVNHKMFSSRHNLIQTDKETERQILNQEDTNEERQTITQTHSGAGRQTLIQKDTETRRLCNNTYSTELCPRVDE